MIKRFQQGGKQELIMQMFMLDLGAALGAQSELEALQAGLAAVLKMGKEKAQQVFQAWGQAEQLQQGGGRKVLTKMLQGGLQMQSMNLNPVMSAKQGAALRFSELNGKCPEGYEIEKYLAGGCVKCRKGKKINKSLTEELKCGGKKRFTTKNQEGGEIIDANAVQKLQNAIKNNYVNYMQMLKRLWEQLQAIKNELALKRPNTILPGMYDYAQPSNDLLRILNNMA